LSSEASTTDADAQSAIARAREFANGLRASLPTTVDVAALGVKSKAPFQLLCAREALIWRTEELARNACDALERDDLAVASILTRSIAENTALVWKLMELLEERIKYTPKELSEKLMRALVGWKSDPDFPEAYNILSLIDRMDKRIGGGVRASYDRLSEIAHPNWNGALALYSKTDRENFVTYFGRFPEKAESRRRSTANVLAACLGCFEYAYNKISDMVPAFLGELESLWADEKEGDDDPAIV